MGVAEPMRRYLKAPAFQAAQREQQAFCSAPPKELSQAIGASLNYVRHRVSAL